MAAKKVKKKKSQIKVVDGDGGVAVAEPRNKVVKPRGVDWGVRVRDGERIASMGRGDRVAEELAACKDVDSLVAFASEFIDKADVVAYLNRAPNFGQFRMVIGNRVRGAVNRESRERAKKGAKS